MNKAQFEAIASAQRASGLLPREEASPQDNMASDHYYKLTKGQIALLLRGLSLHEEALREQMAQDLKTAQDPKMVARWSAPYFSALGRVQELKKALDNPQRVKLSDDG